jgi:hypothetical protein
MIDVSVIIVNWNTRDILRDCLQSVYEQTLDIRFEVIVVDNASNDKSVEMVRREFPRVVLIENSENRGFAAANNQAMQIAKGRYALLLNSDTVVLEGAIQKTIIYADQNPKTGVIGCRAIWPDGRRQNNCFRFPTLFLVAIGSILFFRMAKPFCVSLFHPERYLDRDFEQEQDVDVVAGCFFLVRRDVIDQVGMFDEDFFMYGEEAEWCHRITKKNWRIRYFPSVQIIHMHGASSQQVEDDTKVNKRKANILFLYKTKGPFHAWLANLIMAVGVLLRIPFWIFADIFGLMVGHKINKIWNRRVRVIWFHLVGLCYPVWKP